MSYLFGAKFIQIPRGTTAEVTVSSVWEDADGTSSPLDLTGAVFLFVVKVFSTDKTPIFSRRGTAGSGFTVASPKAGSFKFVLSATETNKIQEGVYCYDLRVELPSGTYQLAENESFEIT